MRKIIFLILVLTANCASKSPVIEYKPSPIEGCVNLPDVKTRLGCISRMLKTLENYKNADIQVKTTKLERKDEEYYIVKDTYCFVSSETKEVYFCFDAKRDDFYDPTFLGIVYDYSKKIGIGGVIGLFTGVYLGK